ncbi:MAG: TrbG/VirB9 family P-type conjugative transfer protein [Alphaproteobacteria bacterium]|nr:TrbG/VirB9 family P-type conjugative transfer protein [Alphaproteobacteria bacterium]
MNRYVSKILSVFALVAAPISVHAQASIDSLNQNADQSQGMYQPMNMGYTGISSLGMMQSAWLDPLQNLGEGQSKPAYSRYYWSPDLVLPVRLREGMLTLVNFPEWELVEDVYIGDSKTFDARISGPNTLLLYPKSGAMVGVDTNIMVFGRSGNKYAFYARSEGVNTERLTNSIIDIEVVDAEKNGGPAGSIGSGSSGGRVNASAYRADNSKSADSLFTKRNQKEDWIQNIPLDPTKFRFDIEVYVPNPDDVVIAPERVWRDDIFTYIDFGEKALNMVQRPIVTLIVERVETPVGFRSAGPNNRLIIVEGVGDMVLRNGKRLICLKLRRADDAGLEYVEYAESDDWQVPQPLPSGKQAKVSGKGGAVQGFGSADGNGGSMYNAGAAAGGNGTNAMGGATFVGVDVNAAGSASDGNSLNVGGKGTGKGGLNIDYSKMHRVDNKGKMPAGNNPFADYRYGSGFEGDDVASISVELGTDSDVGNLENLWGELSRKYSSALGGYQPFYSVDAPADGQGRELFHLRIGPVQSIDAGDEICSQLGRNGVFCSVVRIQ